MTTAPPKPMTLPEFVDFLDTVEEKYELIDGRPVMMAGAARPHLRLSSDLNSLINNALDGPESSCEGFDADLKVLVPSGRVYFPDATIACPPRFVATGTIDNPSAVFEILSPSSEERDRQLKFSDYSAIPELREIIFVESRSKFVEIYRRDSATADWTFSPRNTGLFALPSANIELDVDRVYRNWSPALVAESL